MLKPADVVVIGSGGLGAATAFYLAKRNAGAVVLVDRHEIGSQTSPPRLEWRLNVETAVSFAQIAVIPRWERTRSNQPNAACRECCTGHAR